MTDELAVIAQRAQAFTNASGAAIALSEGITDEIVCKARSGSSAPEVGAVLRVEGSFTGVCIQSGRELRCDDTETDTRVDTIAVRALGIRSMVITPIKEENRAVGVLAVFASTPHAFTITHVAVLKTMADQISGLMQKERRAREEGLHPEPPPRIPAAPAPGPVAVKPIAPVAAPIPIRPVTPMPIRVEPLQPMALAADVAVPVPFPRREEPRPELKEQPVLKTNFGTFDSFNEQPRSGGAKLVIFGLLALVLAGAAGTWFYVRAKRAQNNTAQIAQPAPPAVTGQPAAELNAAANNGTTTGASTPATASPGASSAVPNTPAAAQPAAPAPVLSIKPSDRTEAAKKVAPQEKPSPSTPAPVALTGGSSKISVNTQQTPAAPETAPSLSVGNNGSSALSTLARPASSAAPTASLAQSELVDVQLIRSVPPLYPAIARVRRVTGTVDIKVKVGKDGKVIAAQFMSGPEIFKDAALSAVKQWQYKAATLDGKPIEQETEIKLNFKP
ncbi:MAG: TonB family protein [Acidobacteriia bacterium]|nr:TonB family protein [Terriglobia bacterium]